MKKYTYLITLSSVFLLAGCAAGESFNSNNSQENSSSESLNSDGSNGNSSSEPLSPDSSQKDSISDNASDSSTTSANADNTCDLNGYYADAKCAQGATLKKKLHDIIYSTHTDEISYKNCDSYVADASEDPNNTNNTILFYSGASMSKTNYKQSAATPDFWNKEHVWAKSHGDFASQLAGRDLHHLMPTYSGPNGLRSNNFFDEVKNSGGKAITTYSAYGATVTVKYSDPNDKSYYTSNLFEPRNAVKGDVARIIFYMATRYAGGDGGPALSIKESGTTNGPYMGRLSTLRKWHAQDPVDEFEKNRNEKIYSFQNNRNPFIDYPFLVDLIPW